MLIVILFKLMQTKICIKSLTIDFRPNSTTRILLSRHYYIQLFKYNMIITTVVWWWWWNHEGWTEILLLLMTYVMNLKMYRKNRVDYYYKYFVFQKNYNTTTTTTIIFVFFSFVVTLFVIIICKNVIIHYIRN